MTTAMYPEMIRSTDAEMTFSIGCPTCGAIADELCLTETGWGPDGFAHPDRDAAAIVQYPGDPLIFRAVGLDSPTSAGCSPIVDSVTIELLAEEIAPEFADLVPSADGLFHLGNLGWKFHLIRKPKAVPA